MDTTQQELQNIKDTLAKLQNDFDVLSQNFYKNNFSSHQDFNKSSNFTSKLKVPSFTTLPTCEAGEIASVTSAGTTTLYICSATDTWTIVGTQS